MGKFNKGDFIYQNHFNSDKEENWIYEITDSDSKYYYLKFMGNGGGKSKTEICAVDTFTKKLDNMSLLLLGYKFKS